MSTKTMIVVGASALILSASLVFNGVAHLRSGASVQAAPAMPASAPAQGTSVTDSKTAGSTDANIQVQAASATADAATAADATKDNAVADASATSADDASTSTTADDAAAADTAEPIVVPAGTTLTARLSETIGSKVSEKGQAFSATLGQDVVVDGQTAIPAGSSITGKVVSANPAGKFAGEAALDIRLTSVNVNNVDLPLTTSIRVFGSPIKEKNKVGKFMAGLAKRAEGDEREVVLAKESAYTFTLKQALEIQ
jgi:hypothetical protein